MAEEAVIPTEARLAASPRIGTLPAFARALVLPVEYPLRLLIVGPVAAALIAMTYGQAIYGMPLLFVTARPDAFWLTGILALPFAILWGCAWQRCVAQSAAEPMSRWLVRSLQRSPDYAVAVVAMVLGPALIWSLSFVVGYLFTALSSATVLTNGWWLRIGGLILLLPGLWLYARLSFLPAVVAAHGWDEAGKRAWQLGRGRDLGLLLGFSFLVVIGFVLTNLVSSIFFAVIMGFVALVDDLQIYGAAMQYGYLIGQTIGLTLIGAWMLGFPALIARPDVRSTETNPAVFD